MKYSKYDEPPFKIHRYKSGGKRGWTTWYQRFYEAWLILSGRWTLYRAWQRGLDHGCRLEYERLITCKAAYAELKLLTPVHFPDEDIRDRPAHSIAMVMGADREASLRGAVTKMQRMRKGH